MAVHKRGDCRDKRARQETQAFWPIKYRYEANK